MVEVQTDRNEKVWKKITFDHKEDIDKTIQQMQYIEALQKDDFVFKTQQELLVVQQFKFFLDDIRIYISDS
jgi:Dynein heavy chain, N-terminal region 2